jgi:signal transduction histidine kinase
VSLHYSPEALDVEVADDGRGATAETVGGGYGLSGIRERATALGGNVTAGPRAGGGFVVGALLPLTTP